MNKAIGLILFILMHFLCINAQSFSENEIIGKWSVVQINVLTRLPENQKKEIEQLKDAFMRAKFVFNDDNTFEFDFELEKMRIQHGHWKFNDKSTSIIIQEWKDKDTNNWKLMEIIPVREGSKIIFQMHSIFIDLVMNKDY